MYLKIKSIISNNHVLKVLSLIFGYGIWTLVTSNQQTTLVLKGVPLYFYNTGDTLIKSAPETIAIEIMAKRKVLQALDKQSIAVTLNAQDLSDGKQVVVLENEHLLLPSTVILTNTIPSNITIDIEKIGVDKA